MSFNHIQFSDNLIKGKVGETVFEQMLREVERYTVLPFGYEKVLPQLAHYQDSIKADPAMEAIRRAPDFCVIDHETHEVALIEVKYMRSLKREFVLSHAQRISDSWKPALLFIATPNGFYYGKAIEIVENNGEINLFPHEIISSDIQAKYVNLLNTYIK